MCTFARLLLFFRALFRLRADGFSGGAVGAAAFAGGDGGVDDFDWQYLQGALVLLGAAGRCQRCFAAVEEVCCLQHGCLCVCMLFCSGVRGGMRFDD